MGGHINDGNVYYANSERVLNDWPFISVVVPTYKNLEGLRICVDALEHQFYPKHLYEVIIVDNDDDATPVMSSCHVSSNMMVIKEPFPGSYAARNAGIRRSKGSILAFTDSDCIPCVNWLYNGVKFFNGRPDVAFLGGRIVVVTSRPRATCAEIYEKAYAFRQEMIGRSRDYSVTANLMARREVFDTVGLFDADIFSGGDWEWGKRASRHGFVIGYCEHAIVRHPARSTLKSLIKKHLRVSGGQYFAAKTIWMRIAVIVVGLLPPVVPVWRNRERTDLSLKEKFVSGLLLYGVRVTRSVVFLLMSLSLMKPRRT